MRDAAKTEWPEPATADERLAPSSGFDNRPDVLEAIKICKEAAGGFSADDKGLAFAYRIANDMYAQGISRETALRLLAKFGEPKLSKADLQIEIHRAYDGQPNPPGLRSLVRPPDDAWLEGGDEDDGDWLEGGANVWPRPILYDLKQNNARLSETFLSERPAKIISSGGVLYSLDDGKIWREISTEELAAEMRATDPDLNIDTARLLQMVRGVHIERHTNAQPFEWIDSPADAPLPSDLALFANGVLDVESMALRPHDGRLFATAAPDFEYDPAATCPTWDRFIGECLDESFHETLHEFIGYTLTPDTRYEKLLALVGAKRAGKSTILRVMGWLVGEKHTTSRTLNDLAGEFALEGTQDKKLLIVPDASDTEISKRGTALDRIKAITGNDEVSVNRKGVKIVAGKIPARLAFSANRHPRFLDDSGALASRELLIVFTRTFEGREDRDLSSKLRAELPGIANRALAALRRLRANGGKFTVGKKGIAAIRDVAEAQSPALRFAKAHLMITGNPADRVALPDAFDAYESWTVEESLGARERRNRTDFATDLIAAIGHLGVVHGRRRWRDPAGPKSGDGKVRRGFFGVRLKV